MANPTRTNAAAASSSYNAALVSAALVGSSSNSTAAARSGELNLINAAVAHPRRENPPLNVNQVTSVNQLILDLTDHNLRESAIAQLAKKRGACPDLALRLWLSFGTVAIILQELVSVYPFLSPPTLTLAQSLRVCNALALLQCMASHLETRIHLLKANTLLYLYPFLGLSWGTKPFEYLRLTSWGVIGSLLRVQNTEVILLLLSTEVMPFCLLSMECRSELSRIVATFILQRLLLADVGLDYVCLDWQRFFAINQALRNVVAAEPSAQLLKVVIRCYLRFSEDERTAWILRFLLPERLIDGTFNCYLEEDQTMRIWLRQLLDNVPRPLSAQEAVFPLHRCHTHRIHGPTVHGLLYKETALSDHFCARYREQVGFVVHLTYGRHLPYMRLAWLLKHLKEEGYRKEKMKSGCGV